MKSLSEKIEWYNSVESRRWKRIYHCLEFSIIAVAGFILIGIVSIYGNGTNLQSLLLFFIGVISFSSALMIPGLYEPYFKRWHIFAMTLGLGCSIGVSTLASLFILELQIANA